jgi:heat shock protein HslJ
MVRRVIIIVGIVAVFAVLAVPVLAGGLPPGGGPAGLVGPTWEWQETVEADGTRIVARTPARYTLQFTREGRALLRADCNSGSGPYTLGASSLEFGAIALTRAFCPDSQDTEFLRGLVGVSGWERDGEELVLKLRADSGQMRFSPAR